MKNNSLCYRGDFFCSRAHLATYHRARRLLERVVARQRAEAAQNIGDWSRRGVVAEMDRAFQREREPFVRWVIDLLRFAMPVPIVP